MSYLKQKSEISDRHRENGDLKDTDELLSGFARTDRLCPVITLVLYCGLEKPWDGAKSLHGLLDFESVPEDLKQYVADYPIHVLDICHTPDERLEEFPPDIRVMFLFIKNQNNSGELERCLAREEPVSSDTYDAIADYTGTDELKHVKRKVKEGERLNMCRAIKELVAAGEERGIAREKENTERERQNTERERKNAEREKQRADSAERELRAVRQRIAELERQLQSRNKAEHASGN